MSTDLGQSATSAIPGLSADLVVRDKLGQVVRLMILTGEEAQAAITAVESLRGQNVT